MTDQIREAMEEASLTMEDVPVAFRIQDVFGSSRSYCPCCHRTWSSHISWVKIDLKTQRVLKNWRQRCLNCHQEVNPYITPEELKRMAGLAVKRAQALMTGTFRPMSHTRRTNPHNAATCEKCKYGKRPCWVAKTRPSLSLDQLSADGLATPPPPRQSTPSPVALRSPGPVLANPFMVDDLTQSMAALGIAAPTPTSRYLPYAPQPISPAYVQISYGPMAPLVC